MSEASDGSRRFNFKVSEPAGPETITGRLKISPTDAPLVPTSRRLAAVERRENPKFAPGHYPLSPPPKRSQAADVIAAIERYMAAEERYGLEMEGPGDLLARLDRESAARELSDHLCSFLDWREPSKRFVRYQGAVWTSPEAGHGGYGNSHVVCFDPLDVERFTVDLDAGEVRDDAPPALAN